MTVITGLVLLPAGPGRAPDLLTSPSSSLTTRPLIGQSLRQSLFSTWFSVKKMNSWAWWQTPVILALERQRQEECHEFKANMKTQLDCFQGACCN